MDKAREIALKTLYKIDQNQAYSNLILSEQINKNRKNLNNIDIGFISEIVYGVTTWRLTLDEIIKKYSNIKLKKISPWILNILRMGIYQKIFLSKVPESAAVNESVNLSKRYGHKASSNFVNAVLRKVDRQDYEDFSLIKDQKQKISYTTSMPIWLVEELKKGRSWEEVEKICQNLIEKTKVTVRVNKLKITKEELKTELQRGEIKCSEILPNNAENTKNIPNTPNIQKIPDTQNIKKTENYQISNNDNFLILENAKNIEKSEVFQKGYFTVQDLSAGLAAWCLHPQKGEKVLDACSAPGGKTTYLAELMENEGEIEAWDIHEHRTKLVDENAKRLGITIIRTAQKDATQAITENKKFDKILLDVPCLGIGVIKRKPDIKWQRKPEDIEEITKIQEQILENVSKCLKDGGVLVYSTCSILKQENEEIITKFLQKHKEFCLKKIEEISEKNNGMLSILPDDLRDGFFIAKLQKN